MRPFPLYLFPFCLALAFLAGIACGKLTQAPGETYRPRPLVWNPQYVLPEQELAYQRHQEEIRRANAQADRTNRDLDRLLGPP